MDILKQGNALRAKHKIGDPILVSQQIMGEVSVLFLSFPGRNAADVYASLQKNSEMQGKEL